MGIFDFFFKKKTSNNQSDAKAEVVDTSSQQDDDGGQDQTPGLSPLQPIQIENLSNEIFFNVLASLIRAYGEDFIKDRRFFSAMADYGAFSQDFRYKAILKAIISEGYIVRITTTTIAKSQYDSIFMPFIKEHSFGKDETYYVVENLSRAFNKFNSAPNTGTNPSNCGTAQRIIPDEFISVTYKDLATFEKRMKSEGAVETVNVLNEDSRLIRLYERLYLDISQFNTAIYQVRENKCSRLSISNISYGIKHESYIEYPDKSNGLDHPRRNNKAKFHFNFELSERNTSWLTFLLMGIDKTGRVVYFERGDKLEKGTVQQKTFQFGDPPLDPKKFMYIRNCEFLNRVNGDREDIERYIIFPIQINKAYKLMEKCNVPSGYADITPLLEIRDFMLDIFKYIQILANGKKIYFFYIIDTHKIINADVLYELEAIRGLPQNCALEIYDQSDNKLGLCHTGLDHDVYDAYRPFTPLFDPEQKCNRHIWKMGIGTMDLPVPIEQIAKFVYIDCTQR